MTDTGYHHTQKGNSVVSGLAAATVIIAAIVALGVAGSTVATMAMVVILGIIFLWFLRLFNSLTIAVDDDHVRWHFGPGIWRKCTAIGEIRQVTKVRNKWWYGWGIRYTPHGWLYNINGLDAVELQLDDRRIRLGTDEPDDLTASIGRKIDIFSRKAGDE